MTPLSQPYWLRQESAPGMFRVDDPALIGRPENPPVFPIEQVFEVGGQPLIIPDEPVQVLTSSANNEIRRKLDVIPPVSLEFASDVEVFAPGSSHSVEVEMVAARANSNGALQLEAPDGWKISPAKQVFSLGAVGERKKFTFYRHRAGAGRDSEDHRQRGNRRRALSQPARRDFLSAHSTAIAPAAREHESRQP